MKALQVIIPVTNNEEASEILEAYTTQEGCLGGRVLASTPVKPGWKVQVFFPVEFGAAFEGFDAREVVVIPSQMQSLGIKVN